MAISMYHMVWQEQSADGFPQKQAISPMKNHQASPFSLWMGRAFTKQCPRSQLALLPGCKCHRELQTQKIRIASGACLANQGGSGWGRPYRERALWKTKNGTRVQKEMKRFVVGHIKDNKITLQGFGKLWNIHSPGQSLKFEYQATTQLKILIWSSKTH